MDRRLHQVGGILLLLGCLVALLAVALTPPQPVLLSRLAEMGSSWGALPIFTGIGGSLFLLSTLFLSRHFAGGTGETWAFLGNALLLVGSLVLLGISLLGLPEVVGPLTTGGATAGLAAAFLSDSMPKVAALLFPLSVAAFSASILQNTSWPRWLGWLGLPIGVGSAGVVASGLSLGAAATVPIALTYLWLGTAGFRFMGMRRAKALEPVDRFQETLRERLELGKRISVEDALGVARKVALALESPHRPDSIEPTGETSQLEIGLPGNPVLFEFATDLADDQIGGGTRPDRAMAEHSARGEVRSDFFREWLADPNLVQH